MSDFEVGDRVRVTYEGEVTDANWASSKREIELDGGDRAFCGVALPSYGADVTVLERRKPKVGDIIDRGVPLPADLPNGTVLLYEKSGAHYLKTPHGWASSRTGDFVHRSDFTSGPIVVVHIPAV